MKYFSFLLTLGLMVSLSSAKSIKVPASQAHELYGLRNAEGVASQLLTYSNTKEELEVFTLNREEGKVKKAGSAALKVSPQHALGYEDKIAIVTGQTMKQRVAPVEVALYEKDLSQKSVIYSVPSERSQITSFKHTEGGFLITYYDSKYFTVTGKLVKGGDGKWEFQQLFRMRMATTTDAMNGAFLVGRGYGDKIGDTGDATLVAGGKEIMLPTHNGVSSGCLAQLDDDAELEVILGDGWHMNYGEIAEPRVSVFNYDAEKETYTAQVISNEKVGKQYRLDHISLTNTGLVLAIGTEKSYLFNPKAEWAKKECPASKIVDLGNEYFAYLKGGVKVEKLTF